MSLNSKVRTEALELLLLLNGGGGGGRQISKKPDSTFISDILQSTDKIRRRTRVRSEKNYTCHHLVIRTIVSYYKIFSC